MPKPADPRLQLTGIQLQIHRILTEQHPDCAIIYLAGVVVLSDDGLPDRLAMAAHALRELMEKLPGKGNGIADLNARVKELEPAWQRAYAQVERRDGEKWQGEIGEELRTFLHDAEVFFAERQQVVQTRRDQAVQFLNALEVANIRLPEAVQQENAKAWMGLRQYFNNVSHHTKDTDETEFRARVAQLESFMYARLHPQPIADFAAIDALLRED